MYDWDGLPMKITYVSKYFTRQLKDTPYTFLIYLVVILCKRVKELQA
jgi:hypothetical protein